MRSTALGMIEVCGMLGAVEAADAALKSASVSLLRSDKVGGGLVTVFLTGDVAAVSSAVSAAEASLKRLGLSYTTHVIPRISSEAALMLMPYEESSRECEKAPETLLPESPLGEAEELLSVSDKGEALSAEDESDSDEPVGSALAFSTDELESMTVMELRRLARNKELETLSKKQIRFAGKAELIRELTDFFNKKRGESE